MEKIQELVKEGKLSESLMADKDFVNKAKEIFKSKNVEMSDEKLKQLMSEIEAQIKKGGVLDDKELEQVSGGVSGKGIGRSVIKVTTAVIGAGAGYLSGGISGAVTMGTMGAIGGAITNKEILEGAGKDSNIDVGLAGGAIAGAATGMLAGTPLGAYFGYKLGDLICEKAGLTESN